MLTATFDLAGKLRASWDVVITKPDATSFTHPGAFTIEEGRAPDIWADILGFNAIALEYERRRQMCRRAGRHDRTLCDDA